MLQMVKNRSFENGKVYLLETEDGFRIETTDTFLPYYTKDAIGRKQNTLSSTDLGSRLERWMVGVSVMSGCPVHCKFCATGQMKKWRNLTAQEIVEQVLFVLTTHPELEPWQAREFKINYTRMGEPCLNLDEVRKAIGMIDILFNRGDKRVHHYVSTIGIKGCDLSWVKDNVTLQLSLHSLDEARRDWLIPFHNKLTLKELGEVRTQSNLKTTLNLTLVDEKDFDIEKLKVYFDKDYFFIKLSPINENVISNQHNLGRGIIEGKNLV